MYWPFWIGSIALTAVSVASLLAFRRPLGISGTLSRVLDRDELRRQLRGSDASDPDAWMSELEAATRAAFPEVRPDALADSSPALAPARAPHLSWSTSALLLFGVMVGAALAGAASGSRVEWVPDGVYVELFGSFSWLALVGGGILVGLGTQMAGGCTSGHGLVGCAVFRPGSLVSTACFFGTAIVVSLVLEALLR